ncbi:MAG: efflux RND transporter periplasmic adaptor subunit [Candidatus Sericytochromatia bacterium]
MKSRRTPILIAAAVTLTLAGGGYLAYTQLSPGPGHEVASTQGVYTCPMHPQVVSDKPGSCPICGMDLVKKAAAAPAAPPEETGHPVYTCPMHPQVVSDTPGSCPICGMDLVKKQAAVSQPAADSAEFEGLSGVTLSPRQRVLANVETAPATRRALERAVETAGRVAYDERTLQQVAAWIDGRIDQLVVNTTGETIQKGQVVARLYAPELVSTQQEYLTALAGVREMRDAPYPELAASARELANAARQRLSLMGVTASQIAQLERTGKPLTSFPITSPASGVVVERQVQSGQYVKAGDPLFSLADFSSVWVEADVYESDLPSIKVGQPAEVRVTGMPEKVFEGTVAFIQPVLTAGTRTGSVRVTLQNPGGVLKPEMYANVRIRSEVGDGAQLTVPASAVIATGRHHVVYVETEPNRFVPRTVMVGAKAGDHYPVFEGLEEGEQVAVSGGFLLDASAQLSGQTP